MKLGCGLPRSLNKETHGWVVRGGAGRGGETKTRPQGSSLSKQTTSTYCVQALATCRGHRGLRFSPCPRGQAGKVWWASEELPGGRGASLCPPSSSRDGRDAGTEWDKGHSVTWHPLATPTGTSEAVLSTCQAVLVP